MPRPALCVASAPHSRCRPSLDPSAAPRHTRLIGLLVLLSVSWPNASPGLNALGASLHPPARAAFDYAAASSGACGVGLWPAPDVLELEAQRREEEEDGAMAKWPEGVWWGVLAFLALPDVARLLGTSRAIRAVLHRYFAVDANGVFSIPAFTGRPVASKRPPNPSAPPPSTETAETISTAPTNSRAAGRMVRLFFGQQRRDNHSTSLRHLLHFLVPDMTISHMEAHTNPSNNRGKGCAWVFVPSHTDAARLMAFDKRLFLDVNANGEEVYRLAPPGCPAGLQTYVQTAATRPARPNYLPRQPIVVEMPARPSNKARRHAAPSNPASPSPQTPQTPQPERPNRAEETARAKAIIAHTESGDALSTSSAALSEAPCTEEMESTPCGNAPWNGQDAPRGVSTRWGNDGVYRYTHAVYPRTRTWGVPRKAVQLGEEVYRHDPYMCQLLDKRVEFVTYNPYTRYSLGGDMLRRFDE